MHGPNTERKFGIKGMTERAALAGGQLEIETAPGAGTTAYLQIPVVLVDADDGGVASDG
jgi:signal transduction histidine kinase